ncbi:hypothetical protein FHR55_002080, partial [Xanthomonas arboricola]
MDGLTACPASGEGAAPSTEAARLLQGPCPPTIAGHAVNPSLEALARHPCRSRSRDGER